MAPASGQTTANLNGIAARRLSAGIMTTGHVPGTGAPGWAGRTTGATGTAARPSGLSSLLPVFAVAGIGDEIVVTARSSSGGNDTVYVVDGSNTVAIPSGTGGAAQLDALTRHPGMARWLLASNGFTLWATNDYRAAQPTSRLALASIQSLAITETSNVILASTNVNVVRVNDLFGTPSNTEVYRYPSIDYPVTALNSRGSDVAARIAPSASTNLIVSNDEGVTWREVTGPSELPGTMSSSLALLPRGTL
jgi:hypothetical protein